MIFCFLHMSPNPTTANSASHYLFFFMKTSEQYKFIYYMVWAMDIPTDVQYIYAYRCVQCTNIHISTHTVDGAPCKIWTSPIFH
jgi:hypothetical protein